MTHITKMQKKAREELWEILDADGIRKVDILIAEVVKETENKMKKDLRQNITNYCNEKFLNGVVVDPVEFYKILTPPDTVELSTN